MNLEQIAKNWKDFGLVIIPGFLDPSEVGELRRICDHVLQETIAEASDRAKTSNIAYLTERRYFGAQEEDLLRLLEFVAHPRIVSLLSHLSGELPLFHNTQYFYNPADLSWDGDWHRDTQFLAPEVTLEQERMTQHTGVHFRVAFVADSQLEYVPGSEQRWSWISERVPTPDVQICRVAGGLNLERGMHAFFMHGESIAAPIALISRGELWTLFMGGVAPAIIARRRPCVSPTETCWHG